METTRRKDIRRWCVRILLVVSMCLFLCFLPKFLSVGQGELSDGQSRQVAASSFEANNDLAYSFHYRNLDSVEYYLDRNVRPQTLLRGNSDDMAEEENNRAFVLIIKMAYEEAEAHLNRIPELTDNQLELLVCYVQQMRLCQRQSRNREFYDYRERAMTALKRINEERSMLSERLQRRLLYAESELAIVNSTYYYYVGLEQQSIDALASVPDDVKQDTAQFLNYLYNVGAGGIITEGTQAEINQQEFDCLLRCFQIARQYNYPYFAANALEALSEHLIDPEYRQQLIEDNAPGMKLINPEGIDDDMLPVWLADNALATFREYGDVYQIAGAYRTLASCYRAMGDYESALFNLEQALSDSAIYQAPDLVASIREQLSVAYAAVNDKPNSDLNRNLYLDLQEQTRQDRYMEARADQYDRTATQLNWMIAAVVVGIILLVFSLWLFNYLNQRQKRRTSNELDDLLEQKNEELALNLLHIEKTERINLEQRAKISLVNSITPFIDRIIHEVQRLENPSGQETPDKQEVAERLDYIRELADQINDYNDVLTHWIQLRQGELSLHIESFPLQPLFDLVSKGKTTFEMKQVELNVEPTELVVKADRILTIFMLNTLADNARKFTSGGGRVDIYAAEAENYVEISVSDTGQGMAPEKLAKVFEPRIISDEPQSNTHGFGLMNCKGIIEKYRKISQIFSVCTLQAESTLGKGSRFYFRLPKGVMRFLLILVTGASASVAVPARAAGVPQDSDDLLARASVYADSAYFSNINGTYGKTLLFADSCRDCLNRYYRQLHQESADTMLRQGDTSLQAPEIRWYHDSLPTNFNIVLDIRNESAVAALALHDWHLYAYNNRIYTQLFKEMSADNTLADYCRMMQQSQTNKTIAIVLLVILLVAILPSYYLLYYRHRLSRRFLQEKQKQDSMEALDDELRRTELELGSLHVANAVLDNCLSTLKHETMYYPSRIHQMADAGELQPLSEVVAYYRELYGLLSEQAMRQVERVKLHLKAIPLPSGECSEALALLGDPNLVRFLFEILKKQAGVKKLAVSYKPVDHKYVVCEVPMPNLHLTAEQAQNLFTPAAGNIPYLLCRQIVRDHGEATNRRGCSIRAEIVNQQTVIIITLPKK